MTLNASKNIPAWTTSSFALPTARGKNRTKNNADKSIIFVFFLLIYNNMSYHKYVLHAKPKYFDNYLTFPEKQCIFITDDEDTTLFRGGFQVPLLAGTQDSNFINTSAQEFFFRDALFKNKFDKQTFLTTVRTSEKKYFTPNESVEELRKNDFTVHTGEIFRHLKALPKNSVSLRPYAMKKKIKFAGVSSFNQTPGDVASGLVEVNAMVQGVATIFPRPTGVAISERMNPGDYYEESIPTYKDMVGRIRIGRILDFPNPHSVRVIIDIGSPPSTEEI